MNSRFDPRRGDIEDDASSPKSKSMLALAGSLLVELSFPKLIVAWIFLLIIPGLTLGLIFGHLARVCAYIARPWRLVWMACFVQARGNKFLVACFARCPTRIYDLP